MVQSCLRRQSLPNVVGQFWLSREAGSAGDPSLRLKNGSAQDDKPQDDKTEDDKADDQSEVNKAEDDKAEGVAPGKMRLIDLLVWGQAQVDFF